MFEGIEKSLKAYIFSDFLREYGKLNVIAALIGVCAGLIAIVFRWMIQAVGEVFFGGASPLEN
ncbi:MAG: hypothetical protein JW880_05720, partial [Candidatus Thermoplasmatota archaeon]|nr:hypothetical protein [Candidatus Thermoplasmatota archaeon]